VHICQDKNLGFYDCPEVVGRTCRRDGDWSDRESTAVTAHLLDPSRAGLRMFPAEQRA
jgi:hypothetical protein